jgi:hypothetical protein
MPAAGSRLASAVASPLDAPSCTQGVQQVGRGLGVLKGAVGGRRGDLVLRPRRQQLGLYRSNLRLVR